MTGPDLTRYAWLSVAAALLTIALKATAYLLTGSVGLLSDALESLVNLVAAGVLLVGPMTSVFTHLEPVEDERSFAGQASTVNPRLRRRLPADDAVAQELRLGSSSSSATPSSRPHTGCG